MKINQLLCAGATVLTVSATAASTEPSVELMVQEAAGLLHHSCDSLVEVTGSDEDKIVEVIEKMVAVSLINRQIDVEQYASTDEEREELRDAFVEKLREGCAADRKGLLAGIVDGAVKEVLGL